MHDRPLRLVMLGMIFAIPPLIEAMSPGTGGTWLSAVGRVALVELLIIGGLVYATRQRRRLRMGWHEEVARPDDVPSPETSAPVETPAAATTRRTAARVRLATTPARPAIP